MLAVHRVLCGLIVLGGAISTCSAEEPEFRSAVLLGPRKGVGKYRYYAGRWNLVRMRMVNRSDREAVLQTYGFIGDDSALQYSRVQWLPPQSLMEITYPLWVPATPGNRPEGFNLTTHTFETGGSSEQLVRDDSGKLSGDDLIQLSDPISATGLMGPANEVDTNPDAQAVRALVLGCRSKGSFPPQTYDLADNFLPATLDGYAALEKLVIADNRIADDSAATEAVRAWVASGGSLWIMLDQVQTTTVEKLLGERCRLAEVDRVELNSFTLDPVSRKQVAKFQSAEHELPVPFVRVVAPTAQVEYAIDDWPAAFWFDYGSGKVLVTTLGARGWLRPSTKFDDKSDPIDPAIELSSNFFVPATNRGALPEALQPIVEGYVGYSIPGRASVAVALGSFALLLLGSTVVLWRKQRLEWIGVAAPVLSLAFGAALVLTGMRERFSVPSTVVQLQVAEAIPGGELLRVRGVAGTYFSDGRAVPIQGVHGGRIAPDMTGLSNLNRRLTWTDLRSWKWENVEQPAGMRLAEFSTSVALPSPLVASATCDAEGIHGILTQPPKQPPEDAVILASTGRLGVQLDTSGAFHAGPRDTLGAGQFLAAQVLSDEQRRRSHVLETMFGGVNREALPPQPVLIYWTSPLDGGLRFGEDLQTTGTAMVMVPLTWQRPPVGSSVVIPAPLISFRETTGPDGTVQQGLLSSRTGVWQERSSPGATWLRAQIPLELAPLEMQSLVVTVRVVGQMSRLQLSGWKDGRLQVLQTWDKPAGTLRAELTDAAAFPLTRGGVFLIHVAGTGDDPQAAAARDERKSYWQIESLEVEVHANAVEDSGGT